MCAIAEKQFQDGILARGNTRTPYKTPPKLYNIIFTANI